MKFKKTIDSKGNKAPKEIIDQLTLIELPFLDFSGNTKTGHMVVHKDLVEEVKVIFKAIKESGFPLQSMLPEGRKKPEGPTNNTSAFNYRKVAGTDKLSLHSYGRAIDINPALNPYYSKKGIHPRGTSYDKKKPGTLSENSPVVKVFESYGWNWLGREKDNPDYMHFEKPI